METPNAETMAERYQRIARIAINLSGVTAPQTEMERRDAFRYFLHFHTAPRAIVYRMMSPYQRDVETKALFDQKGIVVIGGKPYRMRSAGETTRAYTMESMSDDDYHAALRS